MPSSPTTDQTEAPTTSAGQPEPSAIGPAVEAVLLAMDKPITAARIAESVGMDAALSAEVVGAAIDWLNHQYEETGRSFRIELIAGGYRIMTLSQFAGPVAAAQGLTVSAKLSRAAVETLAIVAYKQPITRAGVDAIRGVNSGEVLRSLLERRLIQIAGRADELGRPMLYGTTKQFLETFGLNSLRDLPPVQDTSAGLLASVMGATAPAVVEPENTDAKRTNSEEPAPAVCDEQAPQNTQADTTAQEPTE